MRLSDLVKIDNRFEKSVNLLLDLGVQAKIDGYIPTRSSVKVLGEYIHEVLYSSGERASVLIGPYGKGKSHLFLVLLTLLAQLGTASTLNQLISRIEAINPNAAGDIREVMSTKGPLLPVIINTGGGSLNQAFMKGLTSALERDGLSDVTPDSYYSEALKMLQNWETNFPATYEAFASRLGKRMSAFKRKLSRYNESALNFFREVYPELTSGGTFNPNVEEEVIQVYRSVNRTLCERHGYSGIYIVFDEFSKYIEGHPVERFAEDMKVLQDMCELSNASKEEQLHLTCVAHKSIKAYGDALPVEVLNAFKGVEGRLKERLFVVSSQNNYELISDAISKTKAFDEWVKSSQSYKNTIAEAYKLKSFSSLFALEDYNSIVGKGCFPLTPVAAMLLLNLSEKIAQNERTIFTYIAGNDAAGLAQHIARSTTVGFVGADSIYDYFAPLFREETNPNIHHEWLKAEYALSKATSNEEKAIIKSIAVIHMANSPDDVTTTEKHIVLASGLSEKTCVKGMESLSGKKLIEFKQRTRTYEFKNNIGVDVEVAIADTIKKRFTKVDVCSVLQEVVAEKYVSPKKHNMTFCMTRYFNYAFMSSQQFLKLKNKDYLEWPNQPDGVLVMLLPEEDIPEEQVANHLKKLNDPCLVVCIPNNRAGCEDKVRYLLAVRALHANTTFIEDNVVIKKELENLIKESIAGINDWFNTTYIPVQTAYSRDGRVPVGAFGINRLVSDICDAAFPNTPIINHELINRHEVTAQILRARNSILNDLINSRDVSAYEKGTSAESTIYRATMVHAKEDKGLRLAQERIAAFINSCIAKKVSFEGLIKELMAPPFGMRKGVIPFYLLDSLLRLENMPVIYLKGKEVLFDVEAVTNIVKKPKDYSLYVERETVQKNAYIHSLESMFSDFKEYCKDVDKRNQLAKLSCMMQAWYRSLPQASTTFMEPDYPEQDMKHLSAFRRLLSDIYINPRDVLFDRLPKAFGTDDLEQVLEYIAKQKQDIDAHIHCIKKRAAAVIREAFGIESGIDLRQSLLLWYEQLPRAAKQSIFSTRTAALIEYIGGIQTNDDEEIASKIVHISSGLFIEDSKTGFEAALQEILTECLSEINERSTAKAGTQKLLLVGDDGVPVEKFYDFNPDDLSATATFFRSSIDDIIEEYDGVLGTNEKIGVLMDAIKKLML